MLFPMSGVDPQLECVVACASGCFITCYARCVFTEQSDVSSNAIPMATAGVLGIAAA
jgi:hypothetical protein